MGLLFNYQFSPLYNDYFYMLNFLKKILLSNGQSIFIEYNCFYNLNIYVNIFIL